MSELINNKRKKMDDLKKLLRLIESGHDVVHVKAQIAAELKNVAYEDVLAVEQELIAEGMSSEKMLELCDLHSNALHGSLEVNKKNVPVAHPIDTLRKENSAINRECEFLISSFNKAKVAVGAEKSKEIINLRTHLNNLMDIDKHYSVKENIIFPILEKYNITGPSTVMWGKDDQVRNSLKSLISSFASVTADNLKEFESAIYDFVQMVIEMIQKEEEILFPMSLDTLTEIDWSEVYKQVPEIGYCLYAPTEEWNPNLEGEESKKDDLITEAGKIFLPSGNFTANQLKVILNALPIDMTFVDHDDKVCFFTEGKERIFQRSRAIIGRKVQYCHPPSSVDIVEKILADFKSGAEEKASFWIQMHGKFILIEYFALRDDAGKYLGTLEVSQDLTEVRKLEGERRILQYDEKSEKKEELEVKRHTIIYDARVDLSSGVHPVNRVLEEVATLKKGETYLLITPFPPMPLLEKVIAAGLEATTSEVAPAVHHSIFTKV